MQTCSLAQPCKSIPKPTVPRSLPTVSWVMAVRPISDRKIVRGGIVQRPFLRPVRKPMPASRCPRDASWSCRSSKLFSRRVSRPLSSAWMPGDAMKTAGFSTPPVMIYGNDVSHIVTEEGIANLLLCRTAEEREQAVRGVAALRRSGSSATTASWENLRDRGVIQRAEDIGIQKSDATRDRLAARSVHDLVRWSDGRYQPPSRFRNW